MARQEETMQRTYREVKDTFRPKSASGLKHTTTLPWEFAAPGERTDNHAIYRYYREVASRGKLDGFDQKRLDKVHALPYGNWLMGRLGFMATFSCCSPTRRKYS